MQVPYPLDRAVSLVGIEPVSERNYCAWDEWVMVIVTGENWEEIALLDSYSLNTKVQCNDCY